jgi:hypothetical protein
VTKHCVALNNYIIMAEQYFPRASGSPRSACELALRSRPPRALTRCSRLLLKNSICSLHVEFYAHSTTFTCARKARKGGPSLTHCATSCWLDTTQAADHLWVARMSALPCACSGE